MALYLFTGFFIGSIKKKKLKVAVFSKNLKSNKYEYLSMHIKYSCFKGDA